MTPVYATGVHATVENVSRRGFLRGLIATGGLVVAAEFLPARAGLAAFATGAAKIPGWGRQRPPCLCLDRPQRPCDDNRAPRRDGHRLPNKSADGGRRRARSRLV